MNDDRHTLISLSLERPQPIAAHDDVIAAIRGSAHLTLDELPEAPPGVLTLDPAEHSSRITWVPKNGHAVLNAALKEMTSQSELLRETCGPLAPRLGDTEALRDRIEALSAVLRHLDYLREVTASQLVVARSDAKRRVKAAARAVRFANEMNPTVESHWPAVLQCDDDHAARIAKGKGQAKRARESVKKAEEAKRAKAGEGGGAE